MGLSEPRRAGLRGGIHHDDRGDLRRKALRTFQPAIVEVPVIDSGFRRNDVCAAIPRRINAIPRPDCGIQRLLALFGKMAPTLGVFAVRSLGSRWNDGCAVIPWLDRGIQRLSALPGEMVSGLDIEVQRIGFRRNDGIAV